MNTMWIDFRLALRLLVKYPALTMVGGLSIAVAVAVLAGTFAVTGNLLEPRLGLPEADRVVALQNWDVATGAPTRILQREFVTWRNALKSVEAIGAFASYDREVVRDGGASRTVRVAAVTSAAFDVAATPPVLGRLLGEADEAPQATPVVVIASRVWRELFAESPAVIGQTLRISGTPHEIVGVMPDGFRFPLNHTVWIPLQVRSSDGGESAGPALVVFGRMVQGVNLDRAQAELSLLGHRTTDGSRQANSRLLPRVIPYAQQWVGTSRLGYTGARLGLVLLLLVVVANVGALVLARTLAREGEVAVRRALGAARRQIVLQLTVEAFVLVSLSAILGLIVASWGVGVISRIMANSMFGPGGLPFWWRDGLTPGTVSWVGGLSVVSTILCGALPAATLTSRREWGTLQRTGSAHASSRVGLVGKTVIASQFALSVGLLTFAVAEWPDMVQNEAGIEGLTADSYLTAVLRLGEVGSDMPSNGPLAARRTLLQRLQAEPGVMGTTLATALPGTLHPQVRTQTDRPDDAPDGHTVRYSEVGPGFFDVMGLRARVGRVFTDEDFISDSDHPVVVVNESYARQKLGGTAVVGERLRFVSRAGDGDAWREVVGVVPDFGMNSIDPSRPAGVYIPLDEGEGVVTLVVRTTGEPGAFAPLLRTISAALEPLVGIERIQPLGAIIRSNRAQRRMEYVALALGTVAVLLLTMGGLSAVTSFLVSRRSHEMGIRTALGAQPVRVALDIYAGAARRLGWGVAVGLPTGIALGSVVLEGGSAIVAFKVSLGLIVVGFVACVPATRRLLAVDPVEALRGEL